VTYSRSMYRERELTHAREFRNFSWKWG